eukprot:GHRR01004662.1.p1 GENE.GHRR01004662.1~~GHRR01004662.1.p1  ORF type:complete len:196 (+),score=43.46 GHRR01004662.1:345-932(+)
MGGSRRRLKRTAPKVRVAVVNKKKSTKAAVPLELLDQQQDLQNKLNAKVQWQEEATLRKNYQENNFIVNPNEGFGRNKRSKPLRSKAEREQEGGSTYSDDDELRAACHMERKTGKALPKRLTSYQRQIVERLVDKHEDDVESMFRDRKLNPMQHNIGKLKELLKSFNYWRAEQKHDFRVPNKPPSRPLLRGVRTG